jgi:divalent metal cation (Fe/Co/Zn/Cd) transporter
LPGGGWSATTSSGTRQAGARRYVDLHVQFRHGASLEDAHHTAHELQDVIGARLGGAAVQIHLELQDRVRAGEELRRVTAESAPKPGWPAIDRR